MIQGLAPRLVVAGCVAPFIWVGGGAMAQSLAPTSGTGSSEVFVLGTIVLQSAEGEETQGGTGSTITSHEVERANRETLDDALRLAPGVSVGNTGGSRNERLVYVRGFDRFQVPLSVDGVRVYLPADNRLDFGRFLTPDLAEIQIQKGYVSVLNGPGGMGGAINLVTRQPVAPLEVEARAGIELGNRGDVASKTGYLSFGSKQELFWVQGSYLRRDSDGFYLSRDYDPTPVQGAGLRRYSDVDDSRLNLKIGVTPNLTDEYVLSFTRQTGAKNAPYNVDQPVRGITPSLPPGQSWQRDWTWPEWDINSLAFYSHTDLGALHDGAYVKTKAYYNTFDNTLSAFDDSTHTTQTVGRAFDSVYDDKAYGASLELGGEIGANNMLRGAVHYRRDEHNAINYPRPGVSPKPPADPTETSKEDTWSFALENTYRATDDLSFVGGVSYDRATVRAADRTTTDPGYPIGSTDAVNWQLAAIWEPDDVNRYHASVSSRTRFPTLFNRYSTRFGTAVPNPDLDSERALNFEVGYRGDLGPVAVEGAVFYSKLDDMMQSVVVGLDSNGGRISQTQNIGDGSSAGVEIGARVDLTDSLSLSGNYTYLHRDISDPVRPGLKPTDTPRHTANLRLDWQATDSFSLAPSLEMASSRLSESAIQPSDPTQVAYTRNGGFVLANLDAEWRVTENAKVIFGVRNIFDRNYEFVEGYPEAGRSFYVTTALTF